MAITKRAVDKPCCARAKARVTIAEDDLRALARKASRYPEGPTKRLKGLIDEAKDVVARHKQGLVDHEAEHAGEGE